MSMLRKILISAGLIAVVAFSWLVVLTSKSDIQKQVELITRAQMYIDDMVYVQAKPLLEEAAGYSTKNTIQAKELLKNVYSQLQDNKNYTLLLQDLVALEDAKPEIFTEAANYYLETNKFGDAMKVLSSGVKKTNDAGLISFYESTRYEYHTSYARFDNILQISNETAAVQRENKWGIASINGKMVIPCEYDSISNMDNSCAIVKKDGIIYAVNSKNQRTALLKPDPNESGVAPTVHGFTNQGGTRVGIRLDDNWYRCTPEFAIGTTPFEELGVYSDGYAAIKTGGKWGVCDLQNKYLISPLYSSIKLDELGKSYSQGVVFVQNGGSWFMANAEGLKETAYEDAKPFEDGYAAVKMNGKWGFVDANGTLVIPNQWDDAMSFGMHLAAVKLGDKWGYINTLGNVVIEPEFMQAKSFSGGCAPVQLETGWTFISLEEYKKGGGLLG